MSVAAAEYFKNLASTLPDPVAGTAAYKNIDELAYQLSKVPYRTARPIKIIIAGAGISGLSFAHEIETGEKIKSANLTIYEKNAGVGGDVVREQVSRVRNSNSWRIFNSRTLLVDPISDVPVIFLFITTSSRGLHIHISTTITPAPKRFNATSKM